ncbi:MAG: family 16 glycoside hydrolase [Candidatus Sulfotelmatobacter sp.]
MKRLACLLLVALSVAAADNTISKPEADDGWLLLFDGNSLFGWTAGDGAHWTAADGALTPMSDGGFLRTNSAFADFTLTFDYRNTADADCSVYARSAIDKSPGDSAYALQIGDSKPAWPAGSIVDFFRADAVHPAAGQWHSVEATFSGDHLSVKLDGRPVAQGQNSRAKAGVIALGCSKAGRAQFRNLKLKPLLSKPLFNGTDLSGWKAVGPPPPKKAGMLKKMIGGGGKAKEAQWSVAGGNIHGQAGIGQLETTAMYDDFVLQLVVRTNASTKGDHSMGGVFFRGDAGQLASGYDVPIMNDYRNGNRGQPFADSTGSIKGLQAPRKVISNDDQFFTETIAAYGRHIQIWIDGYPVSDYQDPRAEGTARVAAGTISLESPEDKANLDFRGIRLAQLPKTLGKGPAEATAVQPPPPAIPVAVPIPSQPGMPAAQGPDPNKVRVQGLMGEALATSDPEKQKEIYAQILLLDPSNAVAFAGREQAQQKIDAANAQHAAQQIQEQQQTQSENDKQTTAEAARQKAEAAFLTGDLDTANTQIGVAEKAVQGNSAIEDLKSRIVAAIQARTRMRLLWSGFGAAAMIGLIVAWWSSRGKKNAYLEVIDGLDKGKKFNLDQEVIHIGAIAADGGNKNEVVVRDLERQISRFHCEIHKRNGKFFLIDCNSANGTKVDGARASAGKPVRLKNGARIDLAGTCALRLGSDKQKQK